MQNCKICKRSYKNIDAYNVHLNRRSHYRKVVQMELLYRHIENQGNEKAYADWLKIKEECDKPRSSEPQS